MEPLVGGTFIGSSGDGGPSRLALLALPSDAVARRGTGEVFIADVGNHQIRRIAPDGIIETLSGNGVNGFYGDGGHAMDAQYHNPSSIAVSEATGEIWISDLKNQRIRRIAGGTARVVTTVVGTGTADCTGDWGPGVDASAQPLGLDFHQASGSLYFVDWACHTVRALFANGMVQTVAGTPRVPGFVGDGANATMALLRDPTAVAVNQSSGEYFIADTGNHVIRKVSNFLIETVVGAPGTSGFQGDGGLGAHALLHSPTGLAVDGDILYIADAGNRRVRMVSYGLGALISSVAGADGVSERAGDFGLATAARFRDVSNVRVDGAGFVFFVDPLDHSVRRARQYMPCESQPPRPDHATEDPACAIPALIGDTCELLCQIGYRPYPDNEFVCKDGSWTEQICIRTAFNVTDGNCGFDEHCVFSEGFDVGENYPDNSFCNFTATEDIVVTALREDFHTDWYNDYVLINGHDHRGFDRPIEVYMAGGSHGVFITNQATTFKGFRICTVHHCTHTSIECKTPLYTRYRVLNALYTPVYRL
jgi:sugar lactone lactonase YvrE